MGSLKWLMLMAQTATQMTVMTVGEREIQISNPLSKDVTNHFTLAKLLSKFIQLLLQGSLYVLGVSHLGPDPSNGRVQSCANDDTPGLASGDIGSREDKIKLVLVDRLGIFDGLSMLDDGDRLSGEDGLVNPECGGHDGDEPDVSGGLVAHRDLHNVPGHQLAGADVLHPLLVGADDLAHLRLVLLQGLDSVLSIALLWGKN